MLSVARPAASARPRRRHRLDVLAELAHRELRLRSRGSILGIAWTQLAPIAQLAVMTIVFTRIVPIDVEHYGELGAERVVLWIPPAGRDVVLPILDKYVDLLPS